MATGSGVNQGKTAFVEEQLGRDNTANQESINEAWRAAGNEGEISSSLVSKTRSKLGLIGKRKSANGADEKKAGSGAKGKAKSSPKGTKGKGASKAGEAPSQPEVREGGTGPGKSAFVEEVLGRDPRANVAAINRAWSEAGHEGTISDSIVYKVKRERGQAGQRSTGEPASAVASEPGGAEAGGRGDSPQGSNGREAATGTAAVGVTEATGDRGRVVDEVEAGIDDLLFTLKSNGGMPEVEAALRAARRLLTRS